MRSPVIAIASKYAAKRANGACLGRPCVFKEQTAASPGDAALGSSGLSVWTVDGRHKAVPFSGPPELRDKPKNRAFGNGRLSVRRGRVFLTLSLKKEGAERSAAHEAVIGVERGINVLASASGDKRHWMRRGGHTKHARTRYLQVRASLQRRKAERPTQLLRRRLKRPPGREARFMRAVNHEVSRVIIEFAEVAG